MMTIQELEAKLNSLEIQIEARRPPEHVMRRRKRKLADRIKNELEVPRPEAKGTVKN